MTFDVTTLSRAQLMQIIKLTTLSLEGKISYLSDNFNNYSTNYSDEAKTLLNGYYSFSSAVKLAFDTEEYDKLDDAGLKTLAALSLQVSEKYRLGVRTPDDQKEYEETIAQFKNDVYEEAKKRLNGNREELEAFIETLRSEVGNKNGANLGPVYEYSSLQDEIIDLADEYSRAIEMGNEPLARSINQRQKEVGIRRKALKAQYPLVTLIKKTKTSAAVNKEINKLYKKIKKAQDNVEKQLDKNKYPIWELNPVISDLFANVEFYQDASKQKYILEWISEQERIDQLFDAFKNAIPIALSIMCFFMPGGVSVALLILQGANATAGVVAAIDDIGDAGRTKDMAYSQFSITDDQKKLIKDCNVNESDLNYLIAVISGLFVIADVADCARIMKELGYFDDITKTLLHNSKKAGARLLNALSKEDVQKLAHACEKINPTLFNRVAELPENEVIKILNSSDLDGMLKKIDSLSDSLVQNLSNSGRIEDLRFLPDDIKIIEDRIGTGKNKIPVQYYLDVRKATDISTIEQIAKKSGTEQKVINKARELGWSEKEFFEKASGKISDLTKEDMEKLAEINKLVEAPTNDTLMSKVLSCTDYKSFQNYLSGEFSGTVGYCLTKAEDMADCKTYMDYFNKLGLDYTYKDGTPGPFKNGEKMYVMRYTSNDTESLVTRSYGGVNKSEARKSRKVYNVDQYRSFIEDSPYTGTGWTRDHGGGLGKPEFHTIREERNGNLVSKFCEINDGSAIYEVTRDGREKLVAIRRFGEWKLIGGM